MAKKTQTTVHQNEAGQYQVTIPKQLADSMELAGQKVEWKVLSKTALRMEKSDE